MTVPELAWETRALCAPCAFHVLDHSRLPPVHCASVADLPARRGRLPSLGEIEGDVWWYR